MSAVHPTAASDAGRRAVRLHGWRHPSVIAVALLALMAGYGQYSVTAALPDVAAAFGEVTQGTTIAQQAGLSATSLGLGLALIRLASLATQPLSGLADRLGRRRVALVCTAVGLTLTALAATAPSWWWFVAVAALARPQFSTGNAVGAVIASEETRSADRSKALALGIACYGIGVGLVSVVRVPIDAAGLGFRPLYASAALLLVTLPLVARILGEPDRFVRTTRAPLRLRARLRPLKGFAAEHRQRLTVLAGLTVLINLVTGPVNTFVFLYAESILGLSTGAIAAAIVAVGPLGLVGLLVGRWASDRVGRRWTALLSQAVYAAGGFVAYSGGPIALVVGYWVAIVALGAYGPPMGAVSTEVFPTSVRATAAGWLTAASVVGAVAGLVLFGVVIDVTDAFLPAAALVCVPCALSALAFLRLPETKGLELEDSAPEVA